MTSDGTWTVAEPGPDGASAIPVPGPGVSSSQTFDVHSASTPENRLPPAGGITADLLGTPEDVETMVHTIADLCSAREENREEQGPRLAVRLRLG
ncbi:hypothetical protein [Kitasatospora sp. NPDC056531]|uniref:hypothetical protein n=1 Tax=Kitasatospora sp. NPDC056531 TaxID=3345856 RepID=UPI0036CC11AD